MLKWLPFEALETQNQALKELYQRLDKIKRPTLSEDQLALMQYQFKTALEMQTSLTFKIYKHGYVEYVSGKIENIDMTNRMIILKHQKLPVCDILDIFD